MKIQDRLYYCPVCNTESTHQTNHEGEIYVTCKVCKAGVLYFKGGDLGEYIETKIHGYRFNIDNPDEREVYLSLKDSLDGRKCFDARHEPGATDLKILGQQDIVRLYTRQIFDNQWISNFGRLHDWFEAIYPNKKIKEGYYLDMTPEMETLRIPRPIEITTI